MNDSHALVGEYLDGTLARGKLAAMTEHLRGCEPCRDRFDAQEAALASLSPRSDAGWSRAKLETMRASLVAEFGEREAPLFSAAWQRLFAGAGALAAAAALAIFVVRAPPEFAAKGGAAVRTVPVRALCMKKDGEQVAVDEALSAASRCRVGHFLVFATVEGNARTVTLVATPPDGATTHHATLTRPAAGAVFDGYLPLSSPGHARVAALLSDAPLSREDALARARVLLTHPTSLAESDVAPLDVEILP